MQRKKTKIKNQKSKIYILSVIKYKKEFQKCKKYAIYEIKMMSFEIIIFNGVIFETLFILRLCE
jgi:hypothetical protein